MLSLTTHTPTPNSLSCPSARNVMNLDDGFSLWDCGPLSSFPWASFCSLERGRAHVVLAYVSPLSAV